MPVATAVVVGPPTRRSRAPRVALALVMAVVGMIAALLAIPQAASASTAKTVTTVPAHSQAEVTMIWAVQREINKERAAHGLAAVSLDQHLVLSARRHNLTMAAANTMSHQLPGEAFFADRMTAAGYRWTYAGENIAWNSLMTTAGVLQVQQLMYNEKAPNDGHRQNILSTHFVNVGVDVYLDKVHHKVWLTTDFGRH